MLTFFFCGGTCRFFFSICILLLDYYGLLWIMIIMIIMIIMDYYGLITIYNYYYDYYHIYIYLYICNDMPHVFNIFLHRALNLGLDPFSL